MVIKNLDQKLIDEGKVLLEELGNANIPIDAALWLYFADSDSWRLLLDVRDADKIGPREAYRKIQDVLSKFAQQDWTLSLDDIALTKPDSPILELLRLAVDTGQGIGNIRFSNNVINGQLIHDAFIYRLNKRTS